MKDVYPTHDWKRIDEAPDGTFIYRCRDCNECIKVKPKPNWDNVEVLIEPINITCPCPGPVRGIRFGEYDFWR